MKMRMFAQIKKVDAEARKIWGRATQEVVDRANEIFDYDTSKPLFEKWSDGIAKATASAGQEVSLGNIRAMHGRVAAGKVCEITFDDVAKAIDICAEIVDDAEWEKVKKGVYTGFSIGGDYEKRWKDAADNGAMRFTADPVEISIVDLPCVPTATYTMVKAAGDIEELPFERYGALKLSLAKEQITVGDVLSMAKEYLPDEAQDALLKAEAPIGDFLEQLRKLAAGQDQAAETLPADDAGVKTGGAATKSADAAAAAASVPAPAPDPVGAASAPAQGEAAAAATESTAVSQADGAEKAAAAPANAPVKKSLFTVSSLADLLSNLRWIASDAQYEKEWEQDDSPIPARLRAWLGEGAAILVAMTEEETAELIASITPASETVVLALSAEGDLAKAGARHSKSDVEQLQSAHDALVALGAACACDDADKSAAGGELRKRADDAMQKAAVLEAERDQLQARVTRLEKMPAEAKGVVRVAVGKEADTELQTQKGPPAPDPKDPVGVMKGIHATGGRRVII